MYSGFQVKYRFLSDLYGFYCFFPIANHTNANWVDNCADEIYVDWEIAEASFLTAQLNDVEKRIGQRMVNETNRLKSKIDSATGQLKGEVRKVKSDSAKVLTRTDTFVDDLTEKMEFTMSQVRIFVLNPVFCYDITISLHY